MSRVYVLDYEADKIINELKHGDFPGLKHVHQPEDPHREDGKSLWPDGITDGKSTGWFEEPNMLLFWGKNDEGPILRLLANGPRRVRVLEKF